MAADWSLTNFASCGFPVHGCVGSGGEWFHPARQFSDAVMEYRNGPLQESSPGLPWRRGPATGYRRESPKDFYRGVPWAAAVTSLFPMVL